MATTENPSLGTIAQEGWGNHILWRLARALGYEPDENGDITVDADVVLDDALEAIQFYAEYGA